MIRSILVPQTFKIFIKNPFNFAIYIFKLSQEQLQLLEGELMKSECKDSKEQKQQD